MHHVWRQSAHRTPSSSPTPTQGSRLAHGSAIGSPRTPSSPSRAGVTKDPSLPSPGQASPPRPAHSPRGLKAPRFIATTPDVWSLRMLQGARHGQGRHAASSPSGKLNVSNSSAELRLELTSEGPGWVQATASPCSTASSGRSLASAKSLPQLRKPEKYVARHTSPRKEQAEKTQATPSPRNISPRGPAAQFVAKAAMGRRRPGTDSPAVAGMSRPKASASASLMDDVVIATHSPTQGFRTSPLCQSPAFRGSQDEEDSQSPAPSSPQLQPRAIADECVRFSTSSCSSAKPDSPRRQPAGRSPRRQELRSPQRTTQPRSPRQAEQRNKRRSEANSPSQAEARTPRRAVQPNRSEVWSPQRGVQSPPRREVRSPRSEVRVPMKVETRLMIQPEAFEMEPQMQPQLDNSLRPEPAKFVPPPIADLQLSPWPVQPAGNPAVDIPKAYPSSPTKAASTSSCEDRKRGALRSAQAAMRVALLETKRALDAIAQDQSDRASLRAARLALVHQTRENTDEEVELDESAAVDNVSATIKLEETSSNGEYAADTTDEQCSIVNVDRIGDDADPVKEALEAFVGFIEKQDVKTLDRLGDEARQMLAFVRRIAASECDGISDVMVPLVFCQKICQNLQVESREFADLQIPPSQDMDMLFNGQNESQTALNLASLSTSTCVEEDDLLSSLQLSAIREEGSEAGSEASDGTLPEILLPDEDQAVLTS